MTQRFLTQRLRIQGRNAQHWQRPRPTLQPLQPMTSDTTSKRSKADFPWYFAVDDRLIKIVATPDGGMNALVFNPATGSLEANLAAIAACFEPGKAVERLGVETFEQRCQQLLQSTATAEPGGEL